MHSMLMLGGCKACLEEIFEDSYSCSENESEDILGSIYLAIQCVLTCQINVKWRSIYMYLTELPF